MKSGFNLLLKPFQNFNPSRSRINSNFNNLAQVASQAPVAAENGMVLLTILNVTDSGMDVQEAVGRNRYCGANDTRRGTGLALGY